MPESKEHGQVEDKKVDELPTITEEVGIKYAGTGGILHFSFERNTINREYDDELMLRSISIIKINEIKEYLSKNDIDLALQATLVFFKHQEYNVSSKGLYNSLIESYLKTNNSSHLIALMENTKDIAVLGEVSKGISLSKQIRPLYEVLNVINEGNIDYLNSV